MALKVLTVAMFATLLLFVSAAAAWAAGGVSLDDCEAAGGHASGKYRSNPGGMYDGYLIIG